MTKNLLTLFRIQFLNQSGFNVFRYEKDPKKKNKTIAMFVGISILSVIMAGYSFALGYGFGFLGIYDIVPGFAVTITSLVILVFTFFKTNGFIFACRDYDMLMSLPFSTKTIITAKFLYMYISNLVLAAVVMIPMCGGYAVWAKPSFLGYLMWLLGIVITPLFPMTVASAIGAVIIAVGARFRHKVLVQVVLSLAMIVGILVLSFAAPEESSGNTAVFMSQVENIGVSLSGKIHKIYPLSSWFDKALKDNSFINLLLFIIVPVVWYLIYVVIVGKIYRWVNTALTTFHASSNYKVGTLKSSSVMMALVKKEIRRFLSSPPYIINIGVGIIMIMVFTIASIFLGVDKLMVMLGMPGLDKELLYIIPLIIAMITNMSCTSTASLSLEGKNLWIVQSLPISSKIVYQSKMLFNIIVVLPFSLFSSIVFMIELKVSFIIGILYILVSVSTVSFSTVLGMCASIHLPKFEWENEIEVIKQSASSTIGVFSSMIGYFVLGAITFILSKVIPGEIVLLGISVVLGFAALLIYRHIVKQKLNV